jgi:hypothetical protein
MYAYLEVQKQRHDIQQNDAQNNHSQHNDTRHKEFFSLYVTLSIKSLYVILGIKSSIFVVNHINNFDLQNTYPLIFSKGLGCFFLETVASTSLYLYKSLKAIAITW